MRSSRGEGWQLLKVCRCFDVQSAGLGRVAEASRRGHDAADQRVHDLAYLHRGVAVVAYETEFARNLLKRLLLGFAETEGHDFGPELPGGVAQSLQGRLPVLPGAVGAVAHEEHHRPVD